MRRISVVVMALAAIAIVSGCGKNSPGHDEVMACVDHCGDGQCQAIVCMGNTCPCAESAESCPEDCAETNKP